MSDWKSLEYGEELLTGALISPENGRGLSVFYNDGFGNESVGR